MPQTGALFLVAAAAITALPPLNGFIGEWLLFQSLLHGAASGNTASDIAVPLAVAAMALTAGLTVVAFVKAVGIGFLGRPRSEAADDAVEVPVTMRLAVGLLVAVCIVLGVVPTLVFPAVERAVRTALPGARHPASWLMASTCSWSVCGACWPPPRWPVPWRSPWSPSWSFAACWRASPRPAWSRPGDVVASSRRLACSTRLRRSPSRCSGSSTTCFVLSRTWT